MFSVLGLPALVGRNLLVSDCREPGLWRAPFVPQSVSLAKLTLLCTIAVSVGSHSCSIPDIETSPLRSGLINKAELMMEKFLSVFLDS